MADEASWDEERALDQGMPFVATSMAGALLVVLGIAVPNVFGLVPVKLLLAAGAVLGLAAWAIAFAVTIRKAPLVGKLGSLAALLAIGIASGIASFSIAQGAFRVDASTVAEMEIAPNGWPSFAAGASGSGPLSRELIAAVHDSFIARQAYLAETGKFGLAMITSAYSIEQAPKLISNCGEMAAFKPRLAAYFADRKATLAPYLGAVDSLAEPEETRRGLRMAVPSAAELDAEQAAQAAILDSGGALCSFLARRTWRNRFGMFAFSSPGELAQFNARRDAFAAAARAVSDAEHERRATAEKGREIVRTALEGSTAGDFLAQLTQ